MDISDYLRVLRRRWRWFVAPVVLGIVAAAAFIGLSTPKYASSARLFVSTSAQSSDLTQANQGNSLAVGSVQSYADLVETHSLAQLVSDKLGGRMSPEDLMTSVSASVVPNTVNLVITATEASPEAAQQVAQAYAVGLSRLVSQIEAPTDGKPSPIRMSVVDDAQVPTTPASPRKVRDIILGLLLGVVAGVCLALARDRTDTSVSSAADLADVTEKPLLGTIHADASAAQRPGSLTSRDSSPWAEAFRVLRTNMQFVNVDHRDRMFVVSSSVPGEGKTTVVINLAVTLALTGQRVVLVECDLRRPRVAERLGLEEGVGATTVLIGQVSLDDALQTHPGTGLAVLTAGRRPPNPSELLQSHAMGELIKDLRSRFDVVLLDAPPLLPVTDAALLAAQSDGLIMTVRHGKTTREQVRIALQRIEAVDGECAGMVINMAPTSGRGYGYGYGGYEPDVARRGRRKASGRRPAAAAPAPAGDITSAEATGRGARERGEENQVRATAATRRR